MGKKKSNNTAGIIIGSIIVIGAVAAIVNLSQPQVDEPEFPVVKIEENTRRKFKNPINSRFHGQ